MNFLFVHQNFPGQYVHLARRLVAEGGHRVVALTQRSDTVVKGVGRVLYQPPRPPARNAHHYLRGVEAGVLNAQAVARAALELRKSGFVPDVMLGHNGWGEIWYLKEVFPIAPLIGFFEFFYHAHGADVGFDPPEPVSFDTGPRIRTKNIGNLLGLEACDLGLCPTQWQFTRYPERFRPMLRVVHDGIDTDLVRPDPGVSLTLPIGPAGQGISIHQGDEIVTYVARNLEPYRGFPSFMRALPEILRRRPAARVLVVGGDDVSYGSRLPSGTNYRKKMLEELGGAIDTTRVHFLGKVPYPTFLGILQVSAVHVYLTYPFVLSWSMLEAMAAGCLVVGSRTPPVEEVIEDGENGLLVDFFNYDDIAGRVLAALDDPGAFTTLRENARRTVVERYDLNRICMPAQMRLIAEAMAK
ncbi:glycosyltransferase family 4 protein [Propionivibrio dicarboxylicus]|nr:glycosyltransferase family 4 protein [Propionivibrio dicarboxylicus]